MKNKRVYILIVAGIAVAVMLWNVIHEPGIKDLKGDFKEVAFNRNEQNTGPVIRVYAVTSSGEYWKEMEQYGNYMPHNKYGTTIIYFFLQDKSSPASIEAGENTLEKQFHENCIAMYKKDGMGQVTLVKYPYRSSQQ